MKAFIWLVVLGLLALGIYLYLERDVGNPIIDDTSKVPSGYVEYTNSDLGFSLERPVDTTVSVENEGRSVKFMFLGPRAIPNSEITDGFVLTVTRESNATTTDLRTYAEERVEIMEANGGVLRTGPELVLISDYQAYKYTFTTVLENIATEYVLFSGSGRPYTVNTSVFDPDDKGYEEIVLKMLGSLRFE